jgi:predicted nuclease of predicted toxin-antitoxin system
MRILVDENIPNLTVTTLRDAGHDVMDIRGTPRQGMIDDELWRLAQAEAPMLVTTDKGFSEHRDEQHHGPPKCPNSKVR